MANMKHLKRLNREQALKIRRLQKEGGNVSPDTYQADRRTLALQTEMQDFKLRLRAEQARTTALVTTLQSITTMSRAKEARETASRALAQAGVR